jgi:hypothetical protein
MASARYWIATVLLVSQGLACADGLKPGDGRDAAADPGTADSSTMNPPRFLADLPQLKGVSLAMWEKHFRELLTQRKLPFDRSTRAAGGAEYWVHVPWHEWTVDVVFGFGIDGRCTGIQRLQPSPNAVGRTPATLKPESRSRRPE